MADVWVPFVNLVLQLISWGLIVHIIFGWFLDPFHPAREFTSRIFEPMLAPIRQILPQTGMLDFSPIILFILVKLIGNFLIMLV
jgi:YggT family protein